MIFGPVFTRESKDVTRRGRYYVLRVFFAGVLFFAAVAGLSAHSDDIQAGATSMRVLPQIASSMFNAVVVTQYVVVLVLAPIFVCGLLHSERTSGTLDLLFTTHLTDREIIMGKVGSRVAVMMLLAASGMPVLSLVMLFGGIDPLRLFIVESATVLAALYVGSIAIYNETLSISRFQSIAWTYGALVFFCAFFGWIPCLSPTFLVLLAFVDTVPAFGFHSWLGLIAGAAGPLVISIVLFRLAAKRLRGMSTLASEPQVSDEPIDRASNPRRPASNPIGDLDPNVGRSLGFWYGRRHFPLSLAKLLANSESGCLAALLPPLIVLGISTLVYVFVLAYVLTGTGITFVWFSIFALTTYLAAISPFVDRRSGLRDLLLIAPMDRHEYLSAVAFSIWGQVTAIYLIPCALIAVRFFINRIDSLISIVTGVMFGAVVYLMTTICSIGARKPVHAMFPAALLTVAVCGFPRMLAAGINSRGEFSVQPIQSLEILVTESQLSAGIIGVVLCLLVFSGWRVRVNAEAGNVGRWLVMIHLALLVGLVFVPGVIWPGPIGLPIWRIDPLYWVSAHWDSALIHDAENLANNWRAAVLYWLALLVNLAVMWRWTVRNLDRLVDRVHAPEGSH